MASGGGLIGRRIFSSELPSREAWDTDLTGDDLLTMGVWAETVRLALIVTRDVGDPAIGRLKETYTAFIERIARDASAAFVKLADLIVNLNREPGSMPMARVMSLRARYLAALPVIVAAVGTERRVQALLTNG